MGFFNEALLKALHTHEYVCSRCGAIMEFENEWKDTLVCPNCGHEIDYDRYGCESDEEYEALYPTEEEVLGYDSEEEDEDNEFGEVYDDDHGELDDD